MSQYVLIKRAAYYRDGARGYTTSLSEAGLFDKAAAIERTKNVEGVTMKHVDELLAEIDKERASIKEKLALLDKAERNILGLRAQQ